MTNLDIPAYLRLSPEERREAWQGHKVTVQGSGFYEPRKEEEAATRKLRAQLAADAAAKKAEGLAKLKAWKEENKR